MIYASIASVVHAQNIEAVTVVTDQQSGAILKFVNGLKSSLHKHKVNVINSKAATSISKSADNRAFYITVGGDPLAALISRKVSSPILATFISESAYRTITKDRHGRNITAIFSDPDPDYQMKLIKSLYKKPVKVAVLLSEATQEKRQSLEHLATKNELDLKIVNYNSADNIYKALNRISNTDILLAIPDDKIYNHDSIRTIILTTYRHNQALIGFSSGMVKAGALATIAAELEDMADEIKILINNYNTNKRLPSARYFRYFTVKINQHVARSFNVRNTNSVPEIIASIAEQMLTHLDTGTIKK